MGENPVRTRVREEWLYQDYKHLEDDPEFLLEKMLLDVTEQICTAIDERKITRAELARKLGWRRSAVTKLLRGSHNVSLRRLIEIATALGYRWTTPKLVPAPKRGIVETIGPFSSVLDSWDQNWIENLFSGEGRTNVSGHASERIYVPATSSEKYDVAA